MVVRLQFLCKYIRAATGVLDFGIGVSFDHFLQRDWRFYQCHQWALVAVVFRPMAVNGKQWYQQRPPSPGRLSWEPIYADISAAGDMGYTTGPWEFRKNSTDAEAVAFGGVW
jgi:hypothetical protein